MLVRLPHSPLKIFDHIHKELSWQVLVYYVVFVGELT